MVGALLVLLAVDAAPSLSGVVVGPDGQPVEGALVAAVTPNGGWSADTLTHSDTHGAFQLAVRAGRYSLTATSVGLREAFVSGLVVEADKAPPPQTLKLSTGGHRVTGTFVDPQGKPVKGALLMFERESQDEGDLFAARVTGERFEVTLGAGTYALRATAPGLVASADRFTLTADLLDKKVTLRFGPTAAGPEVKKWLATKVVPLTTVEAGHGFTDLAPLGAAIGKARVVSLGEATHGTREFFQLKHRMLEFLVEKLGFTVFAIEANMPEARAVNDYVLEGKGDPIEALQGLYFWTWNTQEVLDQIMWMRRYNEDPAHVRKVKFYGIDMQAPAVALANTRAYFAKVDPEQVAWFDANLTGELSDDVGKALLARFDAHQRAWVKATSAEAFAWARQDARVAVQQAQNARATANVGLRDFFMAENAQWVLDHEGRGAKMVVWAHNAHVSAAPERQAMGAHLRKALGNDLVVVGFAFREGGFQAMDSGPDKRGLKPFVVAPQPTATLADALATAGPLFALDLRRLPKSGVVRDWFSRAQGMLDLGALFNEGAPEAFVEQVDVSAQYDVLLFVEKTTSAKGLAPRRLTKPESCPNSAQNLGFEEGAAGELPTGWLLQDAFRQDGFAATVVTQRAKQGTRATQLRHATGSSHMGWATFMQKVSAGPYRGKRVRLEGWIRTDGKPESRASLWLRADRAENLGFFDNAQERAVSPTAWTPLRVEGQIDDDAVCLAFGAIIWGAGEATFDELTLSVIE
jgi:erythromycin esterase